MIPYLEIYAIQVGPATISTARLLIVVALLAGYFLLLRRSRQVGLDERVMAGFAAATIVGGFLFGHWFKIVYWTDPWGAIRQNPTRLVDILNGQASIGGLFGGILAGWLWLRLKRNRGADPLAAFDAVAYVFPPVWIVARLHCVVTHDHPGIRTQSWLGVSYPDAVRYDLAVLEIVFLLILWAAFVWADRFQPARGTFVASFLVAYGLFRIWLDQFHVDAPRYWGWPVDRWAGMALMFAGLIAVRASWRGIAKRRELSAKQGGEKWLKAGGI